MVSRINTLRTRALKNVLWLSLEEGALVDIQLANGESLSGYWVEHIGATKVALSNATLEESSGPPVRIDLDRIRTVHLVG